MEGLEGSTGSVFVKDSLFGIWYLGNLWEGWGEERANGRGSVYRG